LSAHNPQPPLKGRMADGSRRTASGHGNGHLQKLGSQSGETPRADSARSALVAGGTVRPTLTRAIPSRGHNKASASGLEQKLIRSLCAAPTTRAPLNEGLLADRGPATQIDDRIGAHRYMPPVQRRKEAGALGRKSRGVLGIASIAALQRPTSGPTRAPGSPERNA
jgi:hypothetical protein